MIETELFYPAGLPNPLVENHTLKPVTPFIRTTMVSGRARQRRTFTSVPTLGVVDYIFRGDIQAAAFEAWFRDALNDGVEWFNSKRKTPLGLINVVCRFTDVYTGPTYLGNNLWRFSCPIEIWERPLMPQGWGILPDFIIGLDIFDIAMNREWPEASDYPIIDPEWVSTVPAFVRDMDVFDIAMIKEWPEK